ncbi:hypothetical protein PVK06_032485 [Gossypium arboreum]|uniref:Uncharacterized protein n=1 Tax=Gossypium arboreum TaxID=29729 RepID=A0ABR0NWF3_GOSAR|nr:hypothetical protein PVK06_032485 [Gossypium arboreum]
MRNEKKTNAHWRFSNSVAHIIATDGLKNRVFTYLLNRVPRGAEAVADEERRWTESQREQRGRMAEEEVGGVLQRWSCFQGGFVEANWDAMSLEFSTADYCAGSLFVWANVFLFWTWSDYHVVAARLMLLVLILIFIIVVLVLIVLLLLISCY